MTRSWVVIWVILVPLLAGAGVAESSNLLLPPLIWMSLFERTDGWIGADGAYSVAFSPKRTLWLFSDTWVGKIRNGRRTDATIVNNSVGVQEGIGKRVPTALPVAPTAKQWP